MSDEERLSIIESRVEWLLNQVIDLKETLARCEELLTQKRSA